MNMTVILGEDHREKLPSTSQRQPKLLHKNQVEEGKASPSPGCADRRGAAGLKLGKAKVVMVSAGETWGEKDACMWGGWYLKRNLGSCTSLQVFWKQGRGKPLKEWHQGSVAQLAGLLCRTEGHGFPSHTSTRWTRQRSISRVRSPVPHIASSTEGQTVAVSAEL